MDLLIAGLVMACSMMFCLWVLHLILKNASIVDVGWVYCLVLLGVMYGTMAPGFGPRKFLVTLMVLLWGARLGTYILTRIWGKEEEGRYRALREEWKTNIPVKFLGFFMLQGVLDSVFSLPILFASLNPAPQISILEWLGVGLWCVAFAGETLADLQLQGFKKDPANQGKTCRIGLWNYSRHPNYFFEWLIWVSFFIFAAASPYGWISIACPVLIFYFLFKVSGIPATEAQALRTRGDEYRDYQRTTSAFFPWFPRSR